MKTISGKSDNDLGPGYEGKGKTKQIMRKASKGSKNENPEKEGKTERRAKLT